MIAPSATTPRSRFPGCDPSASRMPNSRVRALTEDASTPANANYRDGESHRREYAKDHPVQSLRREYFRTDICQRGSVLHRLIRGHLPNNVRDRTDQRIRIYAAMDKEVASKDRSTLGKRLYTVTMGSGTTCSSSTSAVTPMMR